MTKLTDILKQVLQEEKTKRDRCLRIADRKYDKPSAYKSGAVVKCRKGMIWKGLKEGKQAGTLYHYTTLESLKDIIISNQLLSNIPDVDVDDELDPNINKGGMVAFTRANPKNAQFTIAQDADAVLVINGDKLSNNYKIEPTHQYGGNEDEMEERIYNDIINLNKYLIKVILFTNNLKIESLLKEKNIPYEINLKETDDPQSGKAAPYGSGYSKVKEAIQKLIQEDESLYKWFKRSGAPGKKGGWVDCNSPIRKDGKVTGYKACGREKGEKRAKYPSCRPTPAQCKSPGKGKKWGKTK